MKFAIALVGSSMALSTFTMTADDDYWLYVNDTFIGFSDSWGTRDAWENIDFNPETDVIAIHAAENHGNNTSKRAVIGDFDGHPSIPSEWMCKFIDDPEDVPSAWNLPGWYPGGLKAPV